MKLYRIIGPDCLRADATLPIIEQARNEGHAPLIFISPDNKSTLVWADHVPGTPTPSSYYELLNGASLNDVSTTYIQPTQKTAIISYINQILDVYPHGGLDTIVKLRLFQYLDYLMSSLMFCDKMPNADLVLHLAGINGNLADIWKMEPHFPIPNTTFSGIQIARLGIFLTANNIFYTLQDNSFVIQDIFQLCRALVRIELSPNLDHLHFQSRRSSSSSASSSLSSTGASALKCPITKQTMRFPVVAADGFNYEEDAIRGWFASGNTRSPVSGLPLATMNLVPNILLRAYSEPQVPAPLFAPVVPKSAGPR